MGTGIALSYQVNKNWFSLHQFSLGNEEQQWKYMKILLKVYPFACPLLCFCHLLKLSFTCHAMINTRHTCFISSCQQLFDRRYYNLFFLEMRKIRSRDFICLVQIIWLELVEWRLNLNLGQYGSTFKGQSVWL